MSREELIVRLQAVQKMDLSNLHQSITADRKLLLYTAAGIIVCSSAGLPTKEELLVQEENSWSFSLLDFALSLDLPKELPPEIDEEEFLYCKEAVIIPYGGKEIHANALVVPLSSVIGFSVGSVE